MMHSRLRHVILVLVLICGFALFALHLSRDISETANKELRGWQGATHASHRTPSGHVATNCSELRAIEQTLASIHTSQAGIQASQQQLRRELLHRHDTADRQAAQRHAAADSIAAQLASIAARSRGRDEHESAEWRWRQ
jgi:hypothetical protein